MAEKNDEIRLSTEQQQALDDFNKGKNIFLTGPAGSGKSEIIRRIVNICEKNRKNYQVCALTGCAAILLNCKAKTVHSWAGIGLATAPNNEIISKIVNGKNRNRVMKKWQDTDVLIIDEVSIMSKKIFELLNEMGKKFRKNTKPFGCIQLIFSGDFYQLPPVSKIIDDDSSAFCFESDNWDITFESVIQLKKIFRQEDNKYSSILNEIRIGEISDNSIDILLQQVGKKYPNETFKPTKLHPKRNDVDIINNTEYSELKCEENIYKIENVNPDIILENEKDKRVFESIPDIVKQYEYEYLKNNTNAKEDLCLKIGTQVMCIVNFNDNTEFEFIHTNSLNDDIVNGIINNGIIDKAKNIDKKIVNGSQGIIIDFKGKDKTPIIKFTNGLTIAMAPYIWHSENIKGIAITQLPLIHAWALTIHKAQGATLDTAEINAGGSIFECGQTYVALSRVKSLDGLYLTAFNPSKIKINKKVKNYYDKLNKSDNSIMNNQ